MLLKERKILRVNLTTGQIKEEEVKKDLYQNYLGGRGLASKYLTEEIDPKVDPLSPENKLIFAPGILAGTPVPTGGRYMVVTKGPLTGTIASSNSGGFFGAELSQAGYLMIIFEGKSEKPVYLSINEGEVKIHSAEKYWGLNTHLTTDGIVEEFGVKGAKVACIGPAGEKLSHLACIMNDKHRAAGRTGVGAVMGSKNLKAIVVKSSTKVSYPDKDFFMKTVQEKNDKLKENAVTGQALPALGTKVLDNIINSTGLYPTNNFQLGTFDKVEEVSGEALVEKKYLQKNVACFACPIACGRKVTLPTGKEGEGPEYESGWAFGADCGVSDLNAITQANFMCNELGLDTITAGATIACAMELYEKGFIPKEDLENGPALNFGSSEAVVYYVKQMGMREGFGDKLAEASYRLAERYGHPEFSMTVKKQEIPAYDPRGVQGQGLAYATSNRGGCHVRAYLISPEVLGAPEKLDTQQLEGKPLWVKIFQDLTALIDSSGMCLFTSFALGADDYKDLINASTGENYSTEDIMTIGERVWNLEKVFNLNAGIKPEEDTLPLRLLNDPLPDGPQKGNVHHLAKLLPEYYQLRGWNEKGVPKEETLKKLGV